MFVGFLQLYESHRSWSFNTFSNYLKTWDMNPRQFASVSLAHVCTIFYTNSCSMKLDSWLTLVRTTLNANSTIFTIFKEIVFIVKNVRGIDFRGVLWIEKDKQLKKYVLDYKGHWTGSSVQSSEAPWLWLVQCGIWGCHRTELYSPNN